MSSNTLPNNETHPSSATSLGALSRGQYKNYASAGMTRLAATAAAKPSD